ncbi:hypothetical protein G9A89_022057 [Geosiphon pyriformis]|nr:hypothetical protein G9A89_022057 [Geosiphon pyriformis]
MRAKKFVKDIAFFFSFSFFPLSLLVISSDTFVFVIIKPVSTSADGFGIGLTGLEICSNAKKKHVDIIYSCDVSYKKPKMPVTSDVVDSSAGSLSLKNIGVAIVKKTSYTKSDNSTNNENMDKTTPKKTHTHMYMLNCPPKVPLYSDISNDNKKKTKKLAVSEKILVNNDVKQINKHSDQEIVVKKIPVNLLKSVIESVFSKFSKQKALVEYESSEIADLVAAKWSVFIRKDSVYVTKAIGNRQMWIFKDQHQALLYILPIGSTAYNFSNLLAFYVTSVSLVSDFDLNMVLNNVLALSASPLSVVVNVATNFSLSSFKVLTIKENVVYWYMSLDNMVSVVIKIKLQSSVKSWISNKFENICIFIFGLKKSFLGAEVAIIMNNSLAHYVSKMEEISGQVISVQLLFKGKLSVMVLSLYAGALFDARFGLASEVNFFIAKTVNSSTFVVLSNTDSAKWVKFRECYVVKLSAIEAENQSKHFETAANEKNEPEISEEESINSENKENKMTTYIAKIPEFNGEDIETSPQEWLDQVTKAGDANGWNAARMLRTIPYFLKETAGEWFENLAAPFNDWNAFKAAFLEQFTDNNTSITLCNRFRNIKQEPFKSVMTYIRKFNKLLRQIRQLETNDYYSDAQILDQFIADLKDKLIKKVRPHVPEDLNSAIQHAKRYEMAMEKANHTKLVNLAIGKTSSAAEEKIDQLTKKVENYFTNQQQQQPQRYQPPQRRNQNNFAPLSNNQPQNCHYCGISGHWKRDCRKLQQDQQNRICLTANPIAIPTTTHTTLLSTCLKTDYTKSIHTTKPVPSKQQ